MDLRASSYTGGWDWEVILGGHPMSKVIKEKELTESGV
jgi:hypothetical protein